MNRTTPDARYISNQGQLPSQHLQYCAATPCFSRRARSAYACGLPAPRTTLSCPQIRAIGTDTTLKSSVTDRDVRQPARLEEMIASWMLILTRSTC